MHILYELLTFKPIVTSFFQACFEQFFLSKNFRWSLLRRILYYCSWQHICPCIHLTIFSFRKLLLPFLSSFFLIIFFLGFPGACLVNSTGSEKLSRLDMLCHTKIISSVPKIFCRKYFQDFSSISEGNRLTVRWKTLRCCQALYGKLLGKKKKKASQNWMDYWTERKYCYDRSWGDCWLRSTKLSLPLCPAFFVFFPKERRNACYISVWHSDF